MVNNRTVVAIIGAPLAVPVLCFLLLLFDSSPMRAEQLGLVLMVSIVFSYSGFIVVGLPVAYCLRCLSWTGYVAASVAGTLSGILFTFTMAALLLGSLTEAVYEFGSFLFLTGAFTGLIVAVVFRLIAGDVTRGELDR